MQQFAILLQGFYGRVWQAQRYYESGKMAAYCCFINLKEQRHVSWFIDSDKLPCK